MWEKKENVTELKKNTEIELYNQILESYMTIEDSTFQDIIAHYKKMLQNLKNVERIKLSKKILMD